MCNEVQIEIFHLEMVQPLWIGVKSIVIYDYIIYITAVIAADGIQTAISSYYMGTRVDHRNKIGNQIEIEFY